MEDIRERTIQSYREWLQQYQWSWFGTLKSTSGFPSENKAKKRFDDWIANLRRTDGGGDFRWFRALERGIGGTNIHFHTVIGGLRNRPSFWQKRWDDLGGEALITRYDPEKKGILYILKDVSRDGDSNFDFEFERQ